MNHAADYTRFPEPWRSLCPKIAAELKAVAGGAPGSAARGRYPRHAYFSSHRLKQHRQAQFMTQIELAKVSGYSVESIGGWERGEALPGQAAIVDLAEALGIAPKVLYTE